MPTKPYFSQKPRDLAISDAADHQLPPEFGGDFDSDQDFAYEPPPRYSAKTRAPATSRTAGSSGRSSFGSVRAAAATGKRTSPSARLSAAAPKTARVVVPFGGSAAVKVGDWLWTCRAGFENDLCEELAVFKISAQAVQPALCVSRSRPMNPQNKLEPLELTFARQGLPVLAVCEAKAALIADLCIPQLRGAVAVQVFAPDSDEGNQLAAQVHGLLVTLSTLLSERGRQVLPDADIASKEGAQLLQVCFLSDLQVAVGVLHARNAPSLFPGGRQRYKKPKDAPARSALKLTEALSWSPYGPGSGDTCVDLGAAPGGWTQVLLERRCRVIAVDPGRLAPHLVGRAEHLRQNAFTYEPETPVDWVLCDMAYRPLEVAALLAKWGRRRWAQFLLANIKLPMAKRVEMLRRVREILETGGWTGMRIKQLYHDREEVTLCAWRGFGIDTRVPQRKLAQAQASKPAPRAVEEYGDQPRWRGPEPSGNPRRNRQATGKGAGKPAAGRSRVAGKPAGQSARKPASRSWDADKSSGARPQQGRPQRGRPTSGGGPRGPQSSSSGKRGPRR